MRLLLAAVALLVLAAATVLVSCTGHTPPIRNEDGDPVAGSIATLEPVEIGGMEQWVLIRGRDASDPILLWLHGGPGASEMPSSISSMPTQATSTWG